MVLALARYALKQDREAVKRTCHQIIAKEKPNSSLRQRLSKLLQRHEGHAQVDQAVELPLEVRNLLMPIVPDKRLDQLVLEASVTSSVRSLVHEQRERDYLETFGLAADNRLLLSGPPGNGKTSLAGAIAAELDIPFLCVDFSCVLSSHMGETGAKIAKIFRAVAGMPCVLFLDEMETVLPERSGRSDRQEVGEMSRVVSTLLLEIDRLSDSVILVGATNHDDLLDRAVKRRFQRRCELGVPDAPLVEAWQDAWRRQHPDLPEAAFDYNWQEGESFSELERKARQQAKHALMQKRAGQGVGYVA
jgi:SpoVK/Ycf46/Vps4 family AAA+-type ATPase